MAKMIDKVVEALKQLSPYVLAVFMVILGALVSTIVLGYTDEKVIPSLGLEVNSSNATLASTRASEILQDGADGIYDVAAITLISTGLMALAVVLSAFGFAAFDRFNIGTKQLTELIKKIGQVSGIYVGIVFVMAIVTIIAGYFEEFVVDSLGFSVSGWVVTSLGTMLGLISTVIDAISPVLGLGVGLLTLGLVLGVFGFEIEVGNKGKSKAY